MVVLLTNATLSFAQESQPGLLATYTDTRTTIRRVVSTPNLSLQQTESIHPQIDRLFQAEWRGLLRIDRAGKYHVWAPGADVQLGGRAAAGMIPLATGEHPLRIKFKRTVGAAHLALRWESEFFRSEPVPSSVLRHLETPADATAQDAIEHGRFLFAELGCANCHSASNWSLQSRRGPDLATAGSRITAGWLYQWLKDPHRYRNAAVMPLCLDTDQDRADVTAFVMSLKSGSKAPLELANPEQIETGRTLFDQVGCSKCHDKENNLNAIGSKYASAAALADFIGNPHATDPSGRMPQLFPPNEQHLAAAVAAFLFRSNKRAARYSAPPAGNVQRGAQLFKTTGCASCHHLGNAPGRDDTQLRGPAFGQSTGLPLRHYWSFGADEAPAVQDHVTGRMEQVKGRTQFARSSTPRGTAFDFNGKTFIELPHFHRPDTMTLSVWVKTTRGGSIITWGRPGGGRRGSRELRMNIGQDGANSICYGEYNSDGGWKPVIVRPQDINVVDGKWHHIAVVRQGQVIQHYVDGSFQGSGKTQKGAGDYTDRLLIGALGLQANPSNRFQGQLDDLSIWEMALSPAQIETLAAGGSPLRMATPEKENIQPFNIAGGCLAEKVKRALPDYQLSPPDRTALQQFLQTVQPNEGNDYHNAPLVLHELRLRQFRCTKCHELDNQNIQQGVTVDDEGRVVRNERPPRLTGAGAKLTSSWLRAVLLEKQRNRPWLNLRMPHFGAGVKDLPALISSAAGVTDANTAPPPERDLATAGLEIIGVRRGQVACITCHDYRGINRRKDGVVPAPDLADAGRTVRQDWFARWMHDPQRLQPGTSMPQLFLEVNPAERQLRIAQLWSALYYQKDLPLPRGVLDQKTAGTRIIVKDKPVLFRMATVTPAGKIDRAINVGLPGGLNFTFDTVSCQLKYAWKGPFIDAGPAWNGRGGNPVNAQGTPLVILRTGHTLRVGEPEKTALPRFLGYRLDRHMPVFRYRVGGALVEHRVTVSPSSITQQYLVHKPAADVFYTGNSDTRFRSQTGQRSGDTIRYQQADLVEFAIELPPGTTSPK
ncbi:MAG: LamG-like jellyroll fold domain-containing protein [Planctomycetota bacterium]|nr:LamG-like jellyroll fold domain-containing protein [Planctomycetota bacterium]